MLEKIMNLQILFCIMAAARCIRCSRYAGSTPYLQKNFAKNECGHKS